MISFVLLVCDERVSSRRRDPLFARFLPAADGHVCFALLHAMEAVGTPYCTLTNMMAIMMVGPGVVLDGGIM